MSSFDDLMDMSMDSIEDLPPVGCPPTGHYNLLVSAKKETNKDTGSESIRFNYVVEAINEVKNPEEESQAAVGQSFVEFFSPLKKDGTVNEWGMKFLKQTMAPYADYFGGGNFAAVLQNIDKVAIAASLTRVRDKKEPDRFNFRLADVVIL